MTTPMEKATIKQVNCPGCQRIVPWSEEQRYRPFCSRKCQLLDFGAWASESFSIPAENTLEPDTEIDQDEEQWSRE